MFIAIGSENQAKVRAVEIVVDKLDLTVLGEGNLLLKGYTVKSGVSDQPMSGIETRQGAIERARQALRKGMEDEGGVGQRCVLGIGMEGGLENVGDEWYECGWMAIVDRNGKIGLGTTARAPVSLGVVRRLEGGEELSEVVDDLSGQTDVRSGQGYMGMITNGALPRDECYTHGLYFAFASFISPGVYWE